MAGRHSQNDFFIGHVHIGIFIALVPGQRHQPKVNLSPAYSFLHGAHIAFYRLKDNIRKRMMKLGINGRKHIHPPFGNQSNGKMPLVKFSDIVNLTVSIFFQCQYGFCGLEINFPCRCGLPVGTGAHKKRSPQFRFQFLQLLV